MFFSGFGGGGGHGHSHGEKTQRHIPLNPSYLTVIPKSKLEDQMRYHAAVSRSCGAGFHSACAFVFASAYTHSSNLTFCHLFWYCVFILSMFQAAVNLHP